MLLLPLKSRMDKTLNFRPRLLSVSDWAIYCSSGDELFGEKLMYEQPAR